MKDLTLEQLSYIIGFLHSDGHLYETTRNRGKISIELKDSDIDILEKLQALLGGKIKKRSRITNFGISNSAILEIYNLETRNFLKTQGLIAGKKSQIVYIPDNLLITDYLRGFIDGDGSIGFTGSNEPFISIVTSSEQFKIQFLNFLESRLNLKKNLNRNRRDNVYNITIKNENALKLGDLLYKDSKIYMNRKYNSYINISSWIRTKKVGNKH